MKALSINPEYVGDIAAGEKTEEYRSWQTNHRGDLLICCTATKISKGYAALIVNLVDCVKDDGCFAWKFEDVRGIKPFVVTGKQRLFEIECNPEIIPLDDEDIVNQAYDELEKEVNK